MVFPAIETRALPGNREDAYRAGMTPRIRCGTIEDSTTHGIRAGRIVTPSNPLRLNIDPATGAPMFDWQTIDWQQIWKTMGQVGLTYVLTAFIGWQREQEEH